MDLVAVKYTGGADVRVLRAGDIPNINHSLAFPVGELISVPIEVWEFFSQHPSLKDEFELVLEDDFQQLELPWDENESAIDDDSNLELIRESWEGPQGA